MGHVERPFEMFIMIFIFYGRGVNLTFSGFLSSSSPNPDPLFGSTARDEDPGLFTRSGL